HLPPVGEHAGVTLHHGDRRAQLVTGDGEEEVAVVVVEHGDRRLVIRVGIGARGQGGADLQRRVRVLPRRLVGAAEVQVNGADGVTPSPYRVARDANDPTGQQRLRNRRRQRVYAAGPGSRGLLVIDV